MQLIKIIIVLVCIFSFSQEREKLYLLHLEGKLRHVNSAHTEMEKEKN